VTAHHLPEGLQTIRSMPMRGFGRVKSSGSGVGNAQGRVGDSTVCEATLSWSQLLSQRQRQSEGDGKAKVPVVEIGGSRTGQDSASASLFHPLRRFSPDGLRHRARGSVPSM
jgi:hypothetical protein